MKKRFSLLLCLLSAAASAQYVPGRVLTAAELNASLAAKTNNVAAAITGGTIDDTSIGLTVSGTGAFSSPSSTVANPSFNFLANGTGAVARTLASKLGDVASVRDYGADPTGSVDSTAAFQYALNASKNVFAPAGTYKLSGTLTQSGPAYIFGAGQEVTFLSWSTSVTSGIALTIGPFTLANLSLITTVAGGGTAVTLNGGGTAPSLYVHNVEVRGNSTARNYWNTGFSVNNMIESVFDSVNMRGQVGNPASMAYGVKLAATGGATNNVFHDCLMNSVGIGINAATTTYPGIEGIYVSNSAFILGNIGITWNGSTSGYVPPGLQVVNSNFDIYDKAIEGISIAQAVIANNIIYKENGTGNPIISFTNGTTNTIVGNYILTVSGSNTSNGIQLYGSESYNAVEGNVIQLNGGSQMGILLSDASNNNLVTGNNVVNGGGGSVVNTSNGSGNLIHGNKPPPLNVNNLFAANATTPSVAGFAFDHFLTANTSPTSVTAFSNAIPGQEFTVIVNDNFTSFVNNASLLLRGGLTYSAPLGTTLRFLCVTSGTVQEVSRDEGPVAPTISSGFGTGASIASNNGTATFRLNVGTGGTASSGVIGLPTATNGWNCHFDYFAPGATAMQSRSVESGSTTTSVTVTNHLVSSGGETAWAPRQVLTAMCSAY
jgi:pectate lyase-like protein